MKKYLWMPSAAVVIGALRVKMYDVNKNNFIKIIVFVLSYSFSV